MRLGLDAVITGNAMYADLMANVWNLHEQGKPNTPATPTASYF
jgi:hypothetical protein